MGQGKHIWETLTEASDLRCAPLPRQPLVEIVGTQRVLIENHLGVIAYSNQEVYVKVRTGRIMICGNCLQIIRLTREQLVVSGSVEQVRLLGEGL